MHNQNITRNLSLDTEAVIDFCKQQILSADKIIKTGKNWYAYKDDIKISVNSYSYTVITAYKNNKFTKTGA